eukprot:TRINITY_DN34051_c0_g1_i1.p3 TRINITY_DN34051_c0_g1~~TRINITY_DN34051_c0_g1_i1.p3  ORF type:complete len:102 (-),score=2.61 TRINITY_DN34051_c0_g1_i1:747-1052(-)
MVFHRWVVLFLLTLTGLATSAVSTSAATGLAFDQGKSSIPPASMHAGTALPEPYPLTSLYSGVLLYIILNVCLPASIIIEISSPPYGLLRARAPPAPPDRK